MYVAGWGGGSKSAVHLSFSLFKPLTIVKVYATFLEKSHKGKTKEKITLNTEGGSSLFHPGDKFRAVSLPHVSIIEFYSNMTATGMFISLFSLFSQKRNLIWRIALTVRNILTNRYGRYLFRN